MPKTKKMDESYFASFLKDITVIGELIRARQDEKQSIMDEFDRESRRFFFGKISERAISSSIKKTNSETSRLDREIKTYMKKVMDKLDRAKRMVLVQEPLIFNATLSGIKNSKGKSETMAAKKKKKASTKKKAVKKKTTKKKKK